MHKMTFNGVFCALITPMSDSGAVERSALRSHVNRLVAEGIDGVVALGTTGEFSELTTSERDEVLTDVISVVDGAVPVVAGIGALGTAEVCEAASKAESAGADALLVLPPLYWGPAAESVLYEHFGRVADATALPVIVYDFPSPNRSPVPPAVVCDLAATHPTIAGVKQSVRDVALIERMSGQREFREAELVLGVGFEDLVFPSYLLGSRLVISGLANFATPLLTQLRRALDAGDWSLSTRCHHALLRLCALYGLSTPAIGAIKMTASLAGMPVGAATRTVPPDSLVDPHEVKRLLDSLERLGVRTDHGAGAERFTVVEAVTARRSA